MKETHTGTLLKKIRKIEGLTQKQLTKILNYENPQFISLIENGYSKMPVELAAKICEYFPEAHKLIIYTLMLDYLIYLEQNIPGGENVKKSENKNKSKKKNSNADYRAKNNGGRKLK